MLRGEMDGYSVWMQLHLLAGSSLLAFLLGLPSICHTPRYFLVMSNQISQGLVCRWCSYLSVVLKTCPLGHPLQGQCIDASHMFTVYAANWPFCAAQCSAQCPTWLLMYFTLKTLALHCFPLHWILWGSVPPHPNGIWLATFQCILPTPMILEFLLSAVHTGSQDPSLSLNGSIFRMYLKITFQRGTFSWHLSYLFQCHCCAPLVRLCICLLLLEWLLFNVQCGFLNLCFSYSFFSWLLLSARLPLTQTEPLSLVGSLYFVFCSVSFPVFLCY